MLMSIAVGKTREIRRDICACGYGYRVSCTIFATSYASLAQMPLTPSESNTNMQRLKILGTILPPASSIRSVQCELPLLLCNHYWGLH